MVLPVQVRGGKNCRVGPSRYALTVLFLIFQGCVYANGSIPPERYQRAVALVDTGTSLLRERRFPEALAAFSAASDLAPLPAALDGQGCVALLEGDFGRADKLFKGALALDESYPEALGHVALLRDLEGRTQEALVLYNQYLMKRPESGAVRNNRAALEYERGGRTIDTAQEFEKAALFSNLGVVKDNLRVVRSTPPEHGAGTDRDPPLLGGDIQEREFSIPR
jgi:tetratricopeptide (TPR) repeat protein